MTETPSQPSSESTMPKRKWRWLQFNLRTLLVLMLVVGAGLGWVAYERRKNARLQADIEVLESLGCEVDGPAHPMPFDWVFNRNPRIVTELFPTNSSAITDARLVHLKGLTSLGVLSLADTAITDAGLKHLKGLTNLTSLSLVGTAITGAGLEHLKDLPSLSYLGLADTAITDAGLEQLRGLTNLEYLSLYETAITDAGLEHLKGLGQLSSVVLYRTSVTKDGVAELQQALPKCSIYHTAKN